MIVCLRAPTETSSPAMSDAAGGSTLSCRATLHWNAYQKRRSAKSIAKKKAECRRLIRSTGSKELLAITERLWQALWHEWPLDRPDPAPPILAQQQAIIAALKG